MPDPVERPYDYSAASVHPQDKDVGMRMGFSDCSDPPSKNMQNKAFSHMDTELDHNMELNRNNAQQDFKQACNNTSENISTVSAENNVETNSPSTAGGAVPFIPESTGSSLSEVIGPTAESGVQEREENSDRPQDENHQIIGDISGSSSDHKQMRVGIGSAVCKGRDSGFVHLLIEQPDDNPMRDFPEKVDMLSIQLNDDHIAGHIMASEVGDTCVIRQVSCDENSCENSLIRFKDPYHLSTVIWVTSFGRIHSQAKQVQACYDMLCHDRSHAEILRLESQDHDMLSIQSNDDHIAGHIMAAEVGDTIRQVSCDENHQITGDVSGSSSNQIRVGIESALREDNDDGRDPGFVHLSTERPNDNPRQDFPEKVDILNDDHIAGHTMAAEVGDTCVIRQVSCDENSCEISLIRLKDPNHLSTVTCNNVDAKVFSFCREEGRKSQEKRVQAYASTATLYHDESREEILRLEAQEPNVLPLKTIPYICTHSVKQAKATLCVADPGLVFPDCRDTLVRNKTAAIQGERKNTEGQVTDDLLPIESAFNLVTQVEKDARGMQANSDLEDIQGQNSAENELDFRETTGCLEPKNSPALQEDFDARGSLRTYHNNQLGIVMLIQMGISKKMSKSRGCFVKAQWLSFNVCPPINKRALVKLLKYSISSQNDLTLETINLGDTFTGKEGIVWPCERQYSEIMAVLVDSLCTKETQRKCDIETHYVIFLPSRGYCHLDKNESLHQESRKKFTVVLLRFDFREMTFQIQHNIQYCQVVIVVFSSRMPLAETVKENQSLECTELFNTSPGNFSWDGFIKFSTKYVSRFLNGCALRNRLHFAPSRKIDGKNQGMSENMFPLPKGKQVVFCSKNAGRASQMKQVSAAHATFKVSPQPLKIAYVTMSTIDFAACKMLDRLQKNHRKVTSKSSRKPMLKKFQNNQKEAKILNVLATQNDDSKEARYYSNEILSKEKPTRECMFNFTAIHVDGLREILLKVTRSVNPNWWLKPSTFQWDLCDCEDDIYFTEVERTLARKMMVIRTAMTASEGNPCLEKTGKIIELLKTGQIAFRNIHEKKDQCRELFMRIVQCVKSCRVGHCIGSVEKKLSKMVQFINDEMRASFVVPQMMDLVKNRKSESFENEELGLRTLLSSKLKRNVWCILRKNLLSVVALIVLKLERETIIDDNDNAKMLFR